MENELGSRYLLDEQIGHGGMGVVWRGHDRSSGAVYAIKVLRPDYASDSAAVGRFIRERAALMAFRHPHVVTLHDMIVEGNRLALVMDFVPGGDLSRLRESRGGRLASGEAARIAAQVADALAAAHATGIAHRDVKPENVLMRDAGHALLADFGIARVAWQPRDTTTGMVLGTAAYMAPEVIAGEEPGPAGDVYALGITLYELLAGQPPFTGNLAAVLHAHASTAPERPPTIGADLWTLISRCLAKEPAVRPAAVELSAALASFAAVLPRTAGGGLPVGAERAAAAAADGTPPIARTPTNVVRTPTNEGRTPGEGLAMAGRWAGPTGPSHKVTMPPLGSPDSRATTKTKRRTPSRAAAAVASAVVVAAVIAGVVLADPFKSGAAKQAAIAPAATDTVAASQPAAKATVHVKTAPSARVRVDTTKAAGPSASPTARQTVAGQPTAPAVGSTTTAAPVSDNTGLECGAISKQNTTHGKYVKSCIQIQGTTVKLEGSAWTIPSGLPTGQYEQVEIVLHTPNGDVGRYTSPHCAAGTCEYSVSVTEPAGEYWAQTDYLWDGINEYQGGFTPKVTVTG